MVREELCLEGWEFPFVMYRPKNMSEGLPLIIQLHGAGEVGNGGAELDKVDINGMSHLLTEDVEFPSLFVLPQCPSGSFWVAEMVNIHSFIERIIQEYKVDKQRVCLTGLSMGGYGTWYTALRYPEMFAAIVPVCGGGMVWKAGVLDMPIWAFHGKEDGVVYPSETENMVNKIRSAGTNQEEVNMTLFDNVGHDSWTYAYTPELINWMLSKTRK